MDKTVTSQKLFERGSACNDDDTVEYPTEAAPSTATVDDETIETARSYLNKSNHLHSYKFRIDKAIFYYLWQYSNRYQ